MKLLRILSTVLFLVIGVQGWAIDAPAEHPNAVEIVEKIGLENFSKHINDEKNDLRTLLQKNDSEERGLIVIPYAQELTYVDGYLSHIGYYADFFIITILEGYSQGLQSSVDYFGNIFLVNYNYTLHYDFAGVTFQHDYWGYTIYTDYSNMIFYSNYNQEILFY